MLRAAIPLRASIQSSFPVSILDFASGRGRALEFSAKGISKSDKAILSLSSLKIEGYDEKPLGQIYPSVTYQSATRRWVAPRRSTRLASLTILISYSRVFRGPHAHQCGAGSWDCLRTGASGRERSLALAASRAEQNDWGQLGQVDEAGGWSTNGKTARTGYRSIIICTSGQDLMA